MPHCRSGVSQILGLALPMGIGIYVGLSSIGIQRRTKSNGRVSSRLAAFTVGQRHAE
jgi:hypothetical protein